jgi:hypothetical protein
MWEISTAQRSMRDFINTQLNGTETICVNKKGLLTVFYAMMCDHMEIDKAYCMIGSIFHEARHNGDFSERTREGIE